MKINSRAYSDMATTGTSRTRTRESRGETQTAAYSGVGHVDLSPEIRALYHGDAGVDALRTDLIKEARRELESGSLFSDQNIDHAIDRLMADLI